jgi:putative membrane protein
VRRSRALFAGLVASQLVYPRVKAQVAATRGIVGLLLATTVADAAERRGGRRAAALAGTAAGIGMAAEWTGVATGRPFSHYAYTDRLGPKVGGVPVLAAASWTMMARPSWVVAGWIDPRPARRAVLAAAALTARDVFVDPRMVRDGYWTWDVPGRYEGIPAQNFVGWLATGAVVFGVWAALDPEPPTAEDDLAMVVYGWTLVGEVVANLAFWHRPVVAAAGGAAMGAVLGPALRRRLAAPPA